MHFILKKYCFLFVWLGFCVILASLPPFTVSLAQDADPWEGVVDFLLCERVTYSQDDAERYLRIYHESWDAGPESWKSYTPEMKAAFDQELMKENGEDKYKFIHWFPSAHDISQDEAICIAYAWIEQTHGLSEDDFRKFFPNVEFSILLADDSFGLWGVEFKVLDQEDYSQYGWYHVYIHSRDGVIVQSNDVTTAKG